MFCFIILNYNSLNYTISSINSIRKITSDSPIIVVDNNSISFDEEKNLTKLNIDLLKLNENMGYAKGNNAGIKYAKEKYNPSFYIILNSDIVLTDKDMLSKIEKDFQKYDFDMLGTKIESPSGESVNPFPAYQTYDNIKKALDKSNKLIIIYDNSILYFLLNIYINVKKMFVKPIKIENGKKLKQNVPLHGCAIIFSKKYIEKYRDTFYPQTFLYYEEEFLYQRIINDKLISVYDPSITIFHNEEGSTNKNSKRDSLLFKEKEKNKSLNLLIKYMEEQNERL